MDKRSFVFCPKPRIAHKTFVAMTSFMDYTVLGFGWFFSPSTFFCIVWTLWIHSKKILSFQEVRITGNMEGLLWNGTLSS